MLCGPISFCASPTVLNLNYTGADNEVDVTSRSQAPRYLRKLNAKIR
jgi:hypothetical protein